jgi:hypothetical protein
MNVEQHYDEIENIFLKFCQERGYSIEMAEKTLDRLKSDLKNQKVISFESK